MRKPVKTIALIIAVTFILSSLQSWTFKGVFAEELPEQQEEVIVSEEDGMEEMQQTELEDNTEQEAEIDYSTWTSDDFDYIEYEQRLYGCDYSRDFTVSGIAIAGFSDTGLEKLTQNTDLVLPSKTPEGEEVVGVARDSFKGKGLTSVRFPSGMLVPYNDTVTHLVTKRGNFVIAENAFANNNLTSVYLPDGVLACMPYAFNNNQLQQVTFPKSIWWVETMSFAKNQITKINFPETTWFQFEMHGMPFADNKIKSVRLPDFTAVVNKHTFMMNPGMEPLPEEARNDMAEAAFNNSGVVYMYTDNINAGDLDRIHHIDKTTSSTHSWFQKLIIYDGTDQTTNPDTESWNRADFVFEGNTILGLSESGVEKRKVRKDLILPDFTDQMDPVWEIADTDNSSGGLFATDTEKFDSVSLPSQLKRIGKNAFAEAGLTEVSFGAELEEIGQAAFRDNQLRSVVLPDTVTALGGGAFASNETLCKIDLSENLTEIPAGAFGCSDGKHWMASLTSIHLPAGLTKIGNNAFAGNNFRKINIPEGVTEIGDFAFSTKNYLLLENVECELTLPEGLTTIGSRAFRNKNISEVTLPSSVTGLSSLVFEKVISSGSSYDIPGSEPYNQVTKVYVSSREQYENKTLFPKSNYHKVLLTDWKVWTPDDFAYGEFTLDNMALCPATDVSDELTGSVHVVTGFSAMGQEKAKKNKNLIIPALDDCDKKVQGVGVSAFSKQGIMTLSLPEDVKTANDKWDEHVSERGDFYICSSAFSGNELTDLVLPEGVIYIGSNAFNGNKLMSVKLPSTITWISMSAFYNNQISILDFPQTTDFPLNIDRMAFGRNRIKSVQLPDKTEKVTNHAFFQNTGKEPVTEGSEYEQQGGIVYLYINNPGAYVHHVAAGTSNTQKLIANQTIPEDEKPWSVNDFSYDDTETVLTGLSDSGKAKIKKNQDVILPNKGPDGSWITEIADGENGEDSTGKIGTFGILNDQPYVPESIQLPVRLETIGDYAFSAYHDTETGEHTALKTIRFPETLHSIGKYAFSNTDIESVILPDNVTQLGKGAFSGTTYLETLVLPTNMTVIPEKCFEKLPLEGVSVQDMARIHQVTIPDSVVTIKAEAFSGCRISDLELSKSLKTIEGGAFENHQLKTLIMPAGLETVGDRAFKVSKAGQTGYTYTLKELRFEEGFEGTIGSQAFGYADLIKVDMPVSMEVDTAKLGKDVFDDNKEGKVLFVTRNTEKVNAFNSIEDSEEYSWKVVFDKLAGTGWNEEDFTYSDDGKTLTGFSDTGKQKRKTQFNVILPDIAPDGTIITKIGNDAFAIPEEDVDVGKYDYNSEYGMKTVDLPVNLQLIGARAFEFNNLTEVDFEGAVKLTSIGMSAFHGNHLRKVHLPDRIDSLGEGAFSANSITDLRLSSNVTIIPQAAFSMNIRLSRIDIPDTVTEIGEMAFAGARLTELEIPASVEKIDRKAFHLHHLSSLTIPGTVKVIGESAFEGTYKAQTLTELTIEEGVRSIGRYAFKEGLLTTTALPMSLVSMGEEPFLNNTGVGTNHTVVLTTENENHLIFNEKAKTHLVVTGNNPFSMEDNDILSVKIAASVVYNGQAQTPQPTVVLQQGEYQATLQVNKDYTLSYKNNVQKGKASCTITGIGVFSGQTTLPFTITAKKITPAVKLSATSFTYNGKIITPSVTVKDSSKILKNKTDYTVIYAKGRRNVGKYAVKVTLKGNYTGSKTVYFTINPKGTAITNITAGKKRFIVKWKKQKLKMAVSVINGYNIEYSTKKNFNSGVNRLTIAGMKNSSKTVTKLTSGKTYYVRIRSYKKVGKLTLFSPWSKVKSIRVK